MGPALMRERLAMGERLSMRRVRSAGESVLLRDEAALKTLSLEAGSCPGRLALLSSGSHSALRARAIRASATGAAGLPIAILRWWRPKFLLIEFAVSVFVQRQESLGGTGNFIGAELAVFVCVERKEKRSARGTHSARATSGAAGLTGLSARVAGLTSGRAAGLRRLGRLGRLRRLWRLWRDGCRGGLRIVGGRRRLTGHRSGSGQHSDQDERDRLFHRFGFWCSG